MKRRVFLAALGVTAAAPVVTHRVYSFLWDNPLVVAARPCAVVLPDGLSAYYDGSRVFIVGSTKGPIDYTCVVKAAREFRRLYGDHNDAVSHVLSGGPCLTLQRR